MSKHRPETNESGMIVIEVAFYFPIVIVVYFAFIFTALFVTQRVVLDRAVAKTCLEASAYLTDLPKDNTESKFSNKPPMVRMNPYIGVIKSFTPEGNTEEFKNLTKKRVKELAKANLIGGYRGAKEIEVQVEYRNYVVFGELVITAKQEITMPIRLSPLGVKNWDVWRLNATAKSMAMSGDSLINDVDFVFDVTDKLTGNAMTKLTKFVAGLPGEIETAIDGDDDELYPSDYDDDDYTDYPDVEDDEADNEDDTDNFYYQDDDEEIDDEEIDDYNYEDDYDTYEDDEYPDDADAEDADVEEE